MLTHFCSSHLLSTSLFPCIVRLASSTGLTNGGTGRGTTRSSSSSSSNNNNNEDEEKLLYGDSHFEVGRQRLVARPLWEQYSKKVRARMSNPTHRGEFSEADAAARGCRLVVSENGAEACGDMVRMYFLVDKKTNVIRDVRFQTFGCATAIAASDITAELCIGKTLSEASKTVTNLAVEKALRDSPHTPAVPPQKMHCSVMSHDVITKAARKASPKQSTKAKEAKDSEDGLNDERIVCECAQVSVGTIRRAIRLNGLTNVAQITQFTKAGGFCKSCVKPGGHEKKDIYIIDILKDELARTKRLKAPTKQAMAATTNTNSNITHKSKLSGTKVVMMAKVQRAVDVYVSPLLSSHGGVATVLDVQETKDGNAHIVFIAYDGTCGSCAAGKTSTLRFIRETLRLEFDEPRLDVRIIEGK